MVFACLSQGSEVKSPRAGLGVHFPQSRYLDLAEKVFGMEAKHRAEAIALFECSATCASVKGLACAHGFERLPCYCLKQYHGRQWRPSIRLSLCTVMYGLWHIMFYSNARAKHYGHTIMAITSVPLMARSVHRLTKQQQRTFCNSGHLYCDDQGSPWPSRGPATFCLKGVQTVYT